MDKETAILSFIKSSLPKVRELEPLLERLQDLGVEDLEDLSYLQESDLLPVLRPVEIRKLLSQLKQTTQQDVLDSPPSNQSNQQFSRASTSTSPVTQSDEMLLSGNSTLAAENFMLSVDQTIVNGHISIFSDALMLMFGLYYCMNMSYPAAQASTLEFLQRCFFKIDPDKGSKVERNATKKQLAVSPKVLTLITKIADYEWRE